MTSEGIQRMTPACAKIAMLITRHQRDGDVADGIRLVDRHLREDRIDREHHDAHAEAEIAAIDIDDELQQEGQPQPAAAVEGEVALQLQLDPRAQREGQRGEQQQPGDDLLEGRLPRGRSGSMEPMTPPAAARNSRSHRCCRTACQLAAVDDGSHHIGGQHRHEIRGIGLDLASCPRPAAGERS